MNRTAHLAALAGVTLTVLAGAGLSGVADVTGIIETKTRAMGSGQPGTASPASLQDALRSADPTRRAEAACEAGKAGAASQAHVATLIAMLGDARPAPGVTCQMSGMSGWMRGSESGPCGGSWQMPVTSPGRKRPRRWHASDARRSTR